MMAWKLFSGKAKNKAEQWSFKTMFGPNMSFAATEAYKLLRTNIMFSFSDEDACHVVGITSAVQSEGKSSTACNTAYALAEAGARVLLLEADLRRPSIASKLGLARTPGLTNLLVSRWDYRETIQHCSVAPNLDIITSGDIPPNPSELLSSSRMARLIEQLSKDYDYILVDLPPVTVVSDAIAISKLLHGIVVVVRGGVSDQQLLEEALRQINMVNLRILGFVYRDTGRSGSKYGGKYSKKYKHNYYTDYARSTKKSVSK